jgi:endo-1,4-beta-xylanase
LRKLTSLCIAFILCHAIASETLLAQTLRERADKAGVLVGTAVVPQLFSEAPYAATLAREFNMIEPENAMKWGAIRPSRDKFNFTPGDQVVEFAKAHGQKVRGHCLLWGKYNPAWLARGQFTPAQLSDLMREHITTVAKHFTNRVFAWDVVNESFDAQGAMEHSIWYDSPGIGLAGKGTGYIEQAFRWARAADPKALLFYNDYDTEGLNAKSDAVYAMARDFKKRGVPLDGVGIQAHIFNLSMKEIASLAANIKRLTALGLQVHITEMDVGLPLDAKGALMDQADLVRQADIYRFVATACLQQPGCTAFQTWGFTDKYSWIPDYTKRRKGAGLLFDQDYHPKPAHRALLGVFSERRAKGRR